MSTPATVDRVEATRRPSGSPVMKQTWSHLLFLHWTVPEAALRPLVPEGLDVDTHEGQAWVGLVPFTVSGARPRFLPPLPGVSNFHEVNVRTYVHRRGREPGVWFFSLDASNALVVEAARRLYKLPYRHAAIEFDSELQAEGPPDRRPRRIRFTSRRIAENRPDLDVRYGPGDFPRPAQPGTLEHFLVERYVLYTADEQGLLYRARVHHQPYPLQPAVVEELREGLVEANRIHRPSGAPLAHYASEVNVDVWRLEDAD